MILLPLLAVLLGPERDVAPPRIGVPPTNEHVNVIIPKGDGFLVGYTADGLPFASSLGPDGLPADARMTPSPLGSAVSAASDGNRYLAVIGEPNVVAVMLLDRDGALIREVIRTPGSAGRRAVVWTGSDYVVSWVHERVVHVLRVSRDGFASGSPVVATSNASDRWQQGYPFVAVASGEVTVAVLLDDGVGLFRVGTESVTSFEILRPANPGIADFIGSGDAFLLLLRELIPGTTVLNVYRVAPGHAPRIASSFPDATSNFDSPWFSPKLVRLTDGVLLYASSQFEIVVQRLTVTGEAAGDRISLLDSRSRWLDVIAATNGRVITFVWLETLTQPLPHYSGADAVVAAVDVSLRHSIDGVSDAVLIAPGASARSAPDVAQAASATLIVWTESFQRRTWIAGRLITESGDSIELDISDSFGGRSGRVATDGVGFIVIWIGGGGLSSRTVDRAGALGERHVIRSLDQYLYGSTVDAIWNGDRYVAVWKRGYSFRAIVSRSNGIYGHTFDRQGVPETGEPRLLVPAAASEPAISSDGERLLLVWSSGAVGPIFGRPGETVDLRARLMSSTLDPLTPDFVVSDDPDVHEIGADIASSGTDWLVAWTAAEDPAGEGGQASIGQARVSREGFVTLGQTIENARNVAVTWSGRYMMVWGEREPALVPGLFVYSRRAPERFLGAAPQVFMRDVMDAPRRRAVASR